MNNVKYKKVLLTLPIKSYDIMDDFCENEMLCAKNLQELGFSEKIYSQGSSENDVQRGRELQKCGSSQRKSISGRVQNFGRRVRRNESRSRWD